MKTRNQFFGLIAMATAFAAIALALALIGCPEPEPTEEQPVPASKALTLGDLTVTLNYKKKASEEVPAYIDRIQNRLTALAATVDPTNVEDYDPENESLVNDLTSRDGNYSINVIYGGASFDAFRAVDGQTLEAHDSWLTDNAGTITAAHLRTAFQKMLLKPIPDENGVPYYGKLPNTTIKIYKGDDAEEVTDEEMADAIARIQTVYTNNVVAYDMVDSFQEYVTSIHIKTGTEVERNGNVVEIGYEATDMDIGTQFLMIAMGMA